MTSNLEFYEALREHIPPEAARLIADRVPQTEQLATKADLGAVRAEMAELRADLRGEMAGLRTEMAELKADIRGWMLSFFVPLWIGVYATLGALVISIVVRG